MSEQDTILWSLTIDAADRACQSADDALTALVVLLGAAFYIGQKYKIPPATVAKIISTNPYIQEGASELRANH